LRVVSNREALSIIAKLRAGKSSIMAEARRLGVYHATLRKEIRAALGSEKEYAKLADQIHHRRKASLSLKGPRERKISVTEARSIIAKIKAGTSSVLAEARCRGVTRVTVRRAVSGVLGGKEQYDKLMASLKKTPTVAGKASEAPSPKPETDPRGANRRPGSLYLQPLGFEIVAGKTVEVKLGETQVLLVQRLGSSMRITSARRTARTFTDALVLGGTVIVPHDRLSDVCDALREAAG
jgi:hypothetical protein